MQARCWQCYPNRSGARNSYWRNMPGWRGALAVLTYVNMIGVFAGQPHGVRCLWLNGSDGSGNFATGVVLAYALAGFSNFFCAALL